MELFIPNDLILRITEHAQKSAPRECCGILFGKDAKVSSAQPIKNIHKNPRICYKMEPVAVLKATQTARTAGDEIVAFYHSHPESPAHPSKIDINDAVKNGWTAPLYVIVSLLETPPQIRAFDISTDKTTQEIKIFSTDQPHTAPN